MFTVKKKVYSSFVVHLNFPLSSWYFLAIYGQPPLPPCPPPTTHQGTFPLEHSSYIICLLPQFINNLHSPFTFPKGYTNIVYPYMYSSPLCSEMTLKSLEMYNNNKTYHKKENEEWAISAWQLLLQLFWADRENTKKEWKSKPGVVTERESLDRKASCQTKT